MAKVLYVDDDEDMRVTFSDQLKIFGHFDVDTATNGQEALDKLKSNAYDVMLLDLSMVPMDGLEVMEHFRADNQYKHIPVIVLTNLSSEKVKERLEELDIYDFLIKTESEPMKLIELVNNAINGVPKPDRKTI